MIHVGIYGFGQIGRIILKQALKRGYGITGVIDIDPRLIGKDAGELAIGEKIDIEVTDDIEDLEGSDVIIHSTGSYLDKVFPQIIDSIMLGSNLLSTCETLSYPWIRYPVLARKIDELARNYGVTVLGAGINPGFLLDYLPTILSVPIPNIKKIYAERNVDPLYRREAFIRKVGVGLTKKSFQQKFSTKEITGHVGYLESALIIMDALGREPKYKKEWHKPVFAEKTIKKKKTTIAKGRVKGMAGGAIAGDDEVQVEIVFNAYVGVKEGEYIRIEGEDNKVEWRSTGIQGDVGTASVILSLSEKMVEMSPGLLVMSDLLPFIPY